jgi:Fe-Mn family superoxide dismutase
MIGGFNMEHKLMELPFEKKALEPTISAETLEYHHGKHHKKYVDTLNSLIKDTEFEKKTLVQIIQNAQGPTFNNAAQVFNHNFYWLGLNPKETKPSVELQELIDKSFGSMEQFKDEFTQNAAKNFGSGWTWLVLKDNKLEIMNTSNADTPIRQDIVPLLTCDVWEHAYYIDYRNARPEYLNKWWEIVNWNFVSKNLAESLSNTQRYIELCNYDSELCDYIEKFYEGEKVAT